MKLTKKQVEKIKDLIGQGKLTQPQIAAQFGVSRSLISDIATGRAHKDKKFLSNDEKTMELEAEILHLTEERNRERAKVKVATKTAGLFKAIVEEVDERIKPFAALPSVFIPEKKGQITEHVVMHLSDCHADQVVRPDEVGGLEEYNFPIACARAEKLVDTIIEWCYETLATKFSFPILWVLAYGDFSSGEIHKACERSYYRNQFRNCLAISQLHSLMYRDLAAYFEQINVLYLSGNHCRRSEKKDYGGGANDNWDYLIGELARLYSRDLKNVSFTIPNSWSANININNNWFHVEHGDDLRSNGGIPWYAMSRRQKGLIALGAATNMPTCRYFVMGHHHTAVSLADVNGEFLVNGAWLGTDQFAYNALTAYKDPVQLLHGCHAKHGVSWKLYVRMKSEYEKKGPKRYIIDGGRDIGPL